jgi:hypothetical protein
LPQAERRAGGLVVHSGGGTPCTRRISRRAPGRYPGPARYRIDHHR